MNNPTESKKPSWLLDNVRRWRIAHRLEPDPKRPEPFRNEPRVIKASKRNVILDVDPQTGEVLVKVQVVK